ncbi:MAG: hypothetical protein QGG14_00870 [Planctomycetota bacterium]|jgi:hypothetical protein|nr:hypothetical protein [Planctomycetota bacterium]
MSLPTYSEYATIKMNEAAASFPDKKFCDEGTALIGTHTAQDAYDQPNPQFWFWALHQLNPAKTGALAMAMVQRLLDAGADAHGLDPVADPAGFLECYRERCGDRLKRKSSHLAFALACRLELQDYVGLASKGLGFMQMSFIGAWKSAMYNATGEAESDLEDSLAIGGGDWFRQNCTFDEFCNGKVEG